MNIQEQEVIELVQDVGGWLTNEEAITLYSLAKNCTGEGVIVEVGSWMGKSTICLGKGSLAGCRAKVYTIDPHTGAGGIYGEDIWTFDTFKENIRAAGVSDIVVPLVSTSEEASKGFSELVELIFIDGGHDYKSVKQDFELWYPKVIDGGVMAFHDVAWRTFGGPRKLVRDKVYKSKHFRNVNFITRGSSIVYATKVRQTSPLDRLRNYYALACKDVYEGMYNTLRFVRRSVRNIFARSGRCAENGG